MFAFRSTNPKRKDKTHTSSSSKKDDHHHHPVSSLTKSIGRKLFVATTLSPPERRHSPSRRALFHEADDNSSVDMSLYTTQSKSTIRYMGSWQQQESSSSSSFQQHQPPREYYLPGHPAEMSCRDDATEYTTERVIHSRMEQHPPTQMNNTSLMTPVTEPLTTPSTSALGDDLSSLCSYGDDNEYDLCATAKMARFTFPNLHKSNSNKEPPMLQREHSDDEESSSSSDSSSSSSASSTSSHYNRRRNSSRYPNMEETPVTAVDLDKTILPSPESSCYSRPRQYHSFSTPSSCSKKEKPSFSSHSSLVHKPHEYGPVDLDESIVDSVSMASSSNSWVMSPLKGMASPQLYNTLKKSSCCSPNNNSSSSVLLDTRTTTMVDKNKNETTSQPEKVSKSKNDDDNETSSTRYPNSSTTSNTSRAKSPIPVVVPDEDSMEDTLSPYVWTDVDEESSTTSHPQDDNDDDDDDDSTRPSSSHHSSPLRRHRRQWSQDDEDALSRSYAQTMESISNSRGGRSSWDEEDDLQSILEEGSPGTLLLTEGELERHLHKVQKQSIPADPQPSSCLKGYDNWKRKRELRARYFAKLQEKAAERQRQRREHQQQRRLQHLQPPAVKEEYPVPATFSSRRTMWMSPPRMMDSTRSAMEQSVDSSIPTLDEASLLMKPRHGSVQQESATPTSTKTKKKEPRRRLRWNIFARLSPKKKKKNPPKQSVITVTKSSASSSKHQDEEEDSSRKILTHLHSPGRKGSKVVPLGHFLNMATAEDGRIEDLTDFSLGPLGTTIGRAILPGEAGGNHNHGTTPPKQDDEDGAIMGHSASLALQILEEERAKQRQAEEEREASERKEQDRIERRKRQELERQRKLNVSAADTKSSQKPPLLKKAPSKDSTDSTRSPSSSKSDKVPQKTLSVCSKESSVFSSLQSHSATFLAPCVVCNAAERSHIAMPCMHFSFCQFCVDQLYKKEPECVHCPICNTSNVAFSQVFTG